MGAEAKSLLTGISIALFLIIGTACCDIARVEQNEIGFSYNVSGGKPVNPENNPMLSFGYHMVVGWDSRFFIINSEVNNYNFTANIKDPKSPYDESLTWDSVEGVTMQVDYTILGKVTDPWKFYANFGRAQRSYKGIEGIQDEKIYEALRIAGQYCNARMGELAQSVGADELRKNPAKYAKILTEEAAKYCEQFGFTITDVIFPHPFVFPGGNTIQKTREMLQSANSELEEKKKAVLTAEEEKKNTIADAGIAASKITAEGDRQADLLLSEANALAEQLQASIEQIGVEGTMAIRMSELQGTLMKKGVIPQAVLTEDSIFGQPFYVGSQTK